MATEPILAIVDKGSFDENRNTNNEAFEEFLNLAENYVCYSAGGGRPGGDGNDKPEDLTLMWKSDTITNFYCQKPKVQVQWGQGWPANIYAPNRVAGCAPLAVAQALTFQRTITTLNLTFSERDTPSTTLDWDNIVKHTNYIDFSSIWGDDPTTSHLNSCNATEKSHYDIGRLTRQLGQDLGSDYSNPNTTNTYPFNIMLDVIKKYFPNRQILKYSRIEGAFPVVGNFNGLAIINAWDWDEENEEYINGHTWVADATAKVERYVRTFYDYNTVTGEYSSMETSVLQDDEYLHFNWGWNGSFDGYFLLNVYNSRYGHSTITKDMTSPNYRYDQKYQALQLVFTIQ